MGKRVALALLAVGLVAGLLFLLGVFEPETARDAAHDGATDDGSDAALRARPGDEEQDPSGEDEPETDATTPARQTGYWLRGRVTQPDGSPAVGAAVRVTTAVLSYRSIGVEVVGHTNEEGAFELDVGPLFRVPNEVPIVLRIEARHPRFIRSRTAVPVTGRDRTQGTAEWRTTLELRSAAVLTGRLVRPDGSPVTNGRVRLMRLVDDGIRTTEGLLKVEATDDAGRFRIAHPEAQDEMVLLANAQGLTAAAVTVRLHLDRTTELEPIVLRRGQVITGWLRLRGEPLPGMLISARREWRARVSTATVGGTTSAVGYEAGTAHALEKRALTDADGRFELSGLDQQDWYIGLLPWGSLAIDEPVVRKQLHRRVSAPAKDVVIDLDGVLVTLHIVDEEGRPIPLKGRPARGLGVSTGDNGTMRVLYPPHTTQHMGINRGTQYVSKKLKLELGGVGADVERTITLARAEPKPASPRSLEVAVQGEGAEHVDLVGLALFEPGSGRGVRRASTLRRVDGVFRDERVKPGTFDVELRPGGTYGGGRSFYLPYRQQVVVPDAGVARITAPLRLGGRIELDVRAPDGRHKPMACTITTDQGSAVAARFVGRGATSRSGNRRLSMGGPSVVDPALPPGAYRLRLSYRGFEDVVLEAEVREGETTVLRATMRRSK